jgi:hypothetical protein
MSIHRLSAGGGAGLLLPPVEALDELDAAALVAVAERAAALHAGALARLARVSSPAPPAPADDYLTAEEVGQFLKAEPSWVYRHARPLGGMKLDGILRFSRRRLDAYLARQARLGA